MKKKSQAWALGDLQCIVYSPWVTDVYVISAMESHIFTLISTVGFKMI